MRPIRFSFPIAFVALFALLTGACLPNPSEPTTIDENNTQGVSDPDNHSNLSPEKRLMGKWRWDKEAYRQNIERKLANENPEKAAKLRKLMNSMIENFDLDYEFTPDGKLKVDGIEIRWELTSFSGNTVRIKVPGLDGNMQQAILTFRGQNQMEWYQPGHTYDRLQLIRD